MADEKTFRERRKELEEIIGSFYRGPITEVPSFSYVWDIAEEILRLRGQIRTETTSPADKPETDRPTMGPGSGNYERACEAVSKLIPGELLELWCALRPSPTRKNPTEPDGRVKYESIIMDLSFSDLRSTLISDLRSTLTELGGEGWRLATACDKNVFIFERPKR